MFIKDIIESLSLSEAQHILTKLCIEHPSLQAAIEQQYQARVQELNHTNNYHHNLPEITIPVSIDLEKFQIAKEDIKLALSSEVPTEALPIATEFIDHTLNTIHTSIRPHDKTAIIYYLFDLNSANCLNDLNNLLIQVIKSISVSHLIEQKSMHQKYEAKLLLKRLLDSLDDLDGFSNDGIQFSFEPSQSECVELYKCLGNATVNLL